MKSLDGFEVTQLSIECNNCHENKTGSTVNTNNTIQSRNMSSRYRK